MSSFAITTTKLQKMVNNVIKCAGNSKFSALTSLINVVVENGTISLTTTDTNNYFTVMDNAETAEPVSFVVNVDLFSKLVSKTTTETISVTTTDDMITFTGNGTYKIPIQLDVDGSPIKYPNPTINSPEVEGTVKTSVIKNVIIHNKPSLAITLEAPYLTGYLCTEDCVISADTFNICKNDVKTFGKTVLVAPNVFELLSVAPEEDITYKIAENKILFETKSIRLYATLMEGVESYPVDTIRDICSKGYTSDCTLPKTAILNIIDRLSLFIKDDEQNGVYMTFTNSGVKLESMNSNGIESVAYQGSNNFSNYTCCIGVDSIKKQFSARTGESVNVYYNDLEGKSDIITIKDDTVTQVISLLDDDRATA